MSSFTIGADPELFLINNGVLKSAIPIIMGTKYDPQPLPSGGNVQRDNVALEFGVKPAFTVDDFVQNIKDTINDIRVILPDNYSMLPIPSAYFPTEELDHPEAKMFGCDPDFDAWTNNKNTKPESAKDSTFRTCGGHIHVGHLPEKGYDFLINYNQKRMFVRVMDMFLGTASVIIDDSKEALERKNLYGKAGCFRDTSYGIEYRTLSNFWVKSPTYTKLMYHLTKDALNDMEKNGTRTLDTVSKSWDIRVIINNGIKSSAHSILKMLAEKGCLSDETLELWPQALEESNDFVSEWS